MVNPRIEPSPISLQMGGHNHPQMVALWHWVSHITHANPIGIPATFHSYTHSFPIINIHTHINVAQYPLVNSQFDPENHQCWVETPPPSPTTGRVSVNLLEDSRDHFHPIITTSFPPCRLHALLQALKVSCGGPHSASQLGRCWSING